MEKCSSRFEISKILRRVVIKTVPLIIIIYSSLILLWLGCSDTSSEPGGPTNIITELGDDSLDDNGDGVGEDDSGGGDGNGDGDSDGDSTGSGDPESIIIVDRTGKKWNITHAVNVYGFDPEGFQFGLGPFAIPPILDPQMFSEGDAGYPEDTDGTIIVGTSINGEARAYPLNILARHEIADENFDSIFVAVGY